MYIPRIVITMICLTPFIAVGQDISPKCVCAAKDFAQTQQAVLNSCTASGSAADACANDDTKMSAAEMPLRVSCPKSYPETPCKLDVSGAVNSANEMHKQCGMTPPSVQQCDYWKTLHATKQTTANSCVNTLVSNGKNCPSPEKSMKSKQSMKK